MSIANVSELYTEAREVLMETKCVDTLKYNVWMKSVHNDEVLEVSIP